MRNAVLAVIVVGGLMGCASLSPSTQTSMERHQLLFRAATQYATLKVIEKNPNYADDIARITGETANMLEAGELMPLDMVEQVVRSKIEWSALTPEETVLIDALIVSVRLELQNAEAAYYAAPVPDAEADSAKAQVVYYTSVVLRWIEQAALMKVL